MNYEQLRSNQAPPPNYLVWAILTTIFCCLPFGIISIVFAAQVNSKWIAGDYDGAWNSSRNAKTWAWVAFAAWAIIAVFYAIAVFAFGISAFWENGFEYWQ